MDMSDEIQECGRTCFTCPAASLCHVELDPDGADVNMAEIAFYLETESE